MRKLSLLFILLFFISFQSNAQFKKLIKKAEHKALEKVLGDSSSGSVPPQTQPAREQEPQPSARESNQNKANNDQQPPAPKPIDFPVTGEKVTALHGIYEWVIDTAAVADKIAQTSQGKYAFDLARQKGLKGTNEQIFQQLTAPQNHQILEEINTAVEDKFPEKKGSEGFRRKKWHNSAWSGQAAIPSGTPAPGNNPAWGGVAIPSLYFSSWGGDFNTWITGRYIKSQMLTAHHGTPTILGTFGIQAAEIVDLEKNTAYSIGSVFGVKFTRVSSISGGETDSSKFRILHTIGVARKFWPVPGIKAEPGTAGKFGPYHTVSGKLIIPVRPFIDPSTGKESNALLVYHDALSGKEDAGPEPGHDHYDPSYKIIYEYYFTHDLDKELPAGFLEKYAAAGFGTNGFCIGVKIEDEKGNSAAYRLTNVQTNVSIDKGQFRVPEDYPVMTQQELNEAVKKQFSLKNLFRRAMKNAGSENEK